MAKKTKLSERDLELMGADIGEVASTIFALRDLAMQVRHGPSEVNAVSAGLAGIIALAEKAGFLSDRCSDALSDICVCGSWEEWARVKRPEAEETTAGVNHG